MLSQKCKIYVFILALVFAVFACPLAILPAQAKNIASDLHQTEGTLNDTTDPEPPPVESEVIPPTPDIDPTPSESSSESSYIEEPSSSMPTESPPTAAPTQEPTWAPDPTEVPNYNQGNTATATPRPTSSPSSSAGITRPTATLKPSTGSTDSSQTEQKESNYVTFATMNVKQNSFATSLFYGGVACIFLGVVGIIVLVILFIKNRRSRKNDRDGIFEEIEQAEIRGRAAQDHQATNARPPQAQQSGQINRPPARQTNMNGQQPRQTANSSGQNAIKPADISMYTEEIDIPAPKAAAPRPPVFPAERPAPSKSPSDPSPQSGGRPFDTEEILREALYQEDDFDDL